MSVTKDDLRDFNRFVDEKLAGGDAESLRELVNEWEATREREEVNAAIRSGLADIDAGRTEPFFDASSRLPTV